MEILSRDNPYDNLAAILEDDGRTVYLYLVRHENGRIPDRGGVKSALWIANRGPAPEEKDGEEDGRGPRMPLRNTRHPMGHPGFSPDQLSLVWLDSGDGVALLEDDRLLAVIPPDAQSITLPGYSIEVVGENELAHAFPEQSLEAWMARVRRSCDFWDWRSSGASWKEIQDQGLSHLEAHLGPHTRYWAVDGGQFPPLAVVEFEVPGGVRVYSTVGMSGQPMPQVDVVAREPWLWRRVEVAMASPGRDERCPRALAAIARLPWRGLTWVGPGHSVQVGFGIALLTLDPVPDSAAGPAPDLAGFRAGGERVNWLWSLPITAGERSQAEEHGSDALLDSLAEQGRGWVARRFP